MASSTPSSSSIPSNPIRVILWSNPRSLSTVFLKSMSQVDDIQIICELYESAYAFGPERKMKNPHDVLCEEVMNVEMDKFYLPPRSHLYDDSICTYKWVQDTMQSTFPGKSVIFAKEFPFSLAGQYNLLPCGFQHTFLIRHPAKCFASLKRVISKIYQTSIPLDFGNMTRFKEMYDLMEYIQVTGQLIPIVIDADDLQRHPESILHQYCQMTGIPYSPKVLEWNAGDDILHIMVATKKMVLNGMIRDGGYFADVFKTTKINPLTNNEIIKCDIAEDLQEAIEANMPFYDKMYALRVKP